jgi:excisionase family DNA binding protein
MRLISVNEAAARLGLSPLTIRRLIRRGELPHVRPTGRAIRVPEDAVEAIIARKGTAPSLKASLRRGA